MKINLIFSDDLSLNIKKFKIIRTLLHTIYKNKLKMITHMNVRHETIKLLEENIYETLFNINCSNIVLDFPPTAKETKAKINKTELNLKAFA